MLLLDGGRTLTDVGVGRDDPNDEDGTELVDQGVVRCG